MSSAVANDVELVRINIPNGTTLSVLRPVERTTSIAVYAGKRSFARREAAQKPVEWTSFRQDIPQGQPITVFVPAK
jgi:hypothetical protein